MAIRSNTLRYKIFIFCKKIILIQSNAYSNIVVSLYTTALARQRLRRYADKVLKDKRCTLLYADTDSLIIKHPKGVKPIEDGMYLGEMTKEYPDYDIKEFISAGPKYIPHQIISND